MSLNSLFVGSSGLTTNSSALDVIGNNLANINTTGYKGQRMQFKDVVYQTLSTGSGSSTTVGGTNPTQVGFGVGVGSIGTLFAQGNLNPTGRSLDAGIQGTGFFVLRDGQTPAFSRAGTFGVDSSGFLVDPGTGFRVQRFGSVGEGSASEPAFQVNGNQDIQIPFGSGAAGFKTTEARIQGNLSSATQLGESTTTAIQVYDSQSTPRGLTVTFTRASVTSGTPPVTTAVPNEFTVTATISGGTVAITGGNVTFGTDGLLVSPATLTATISGIPSAANQDITLQIGTPGTANGLTQFGGVTTASAVSQDGSGFGTLTDVAIDSAGIIQGKFTNGRTIGLAQLAIAGFNNEDGLIRSGSNYFRTSVASGEALIGIAGQGGRGTVQGGALEAANIDIAVEFSRLIVAQRGFQVNARTITAANETLQELANILR